MKILTDPIVATSAIFTKEGVDYESLGIPMEKAEKEVCPFRFNIDEVSTYNPHSENKTTLRMKNGDSFCIDMEFEDFDTRLTELLNERNK